MPFDCMLDVSGSDSTAARQSWGRDQRDWCCQNYRLGCEQHRGYDCRQAAQNAPTLQKTWCCVHRAAGVACQAVAMEAGQLLKDVLSDVNTFAVRQFTSIEALTALADRNADGELSADEFASLLRTAKVGLGIDAGEIVFAACDADGEGVVRRNDLVQRALALAPRTPSTSVPQQPSLPNSALQRVGLLFDQRPQLPKRMYAKELFMLLAFGFFVLCAFAFRSGPFAARRPGGISTTLALDGSSGKLRPSRWGSRLAASLQRESWTAAPQQYEVLGGVPETADGGDMGEPLEHGMSGWE